MLCFSSLAFAQATAYPIGIPGAPTWKATVTSVAALPATGNSLGDARIETNSFGAYVWNGVSWQSFSSGGGGGSGTVTSFYFQDGNGFEGTVTNPTTSVTFSLAVTPTINGVLKASGGSMVSAAANIDYQTPITNSVAVANQFVTGYNFPGTFTRAQPSFTNLSGQLQTNQLPTSFNEVFVDFLNGSDANNGSVMAPWKTLAHTCATITPSINLPVVIHLSGGNNDTDSAPISCPPNISIVSDYEIQISQNLTITGGATNDGVTLTNITGVGTFTWVRNDATEINLLINNSSFFGTLDFEQQGAGTGATLFLAFGGNAVLSGGIIIEAGETIFQSTGLLAGTFNYKDSGSSFLLLSGGIDLFNLTLQLHGGVTAELSGDIADTGYTISGTTTGSGTPTIKSDSGSIPAPVSITGAYTLVLTSNAFHEGYVPTTSGNWSPSPSDVGDALDQLAARPAGSGGGSVSNVSISNANGFTGSVSNPTTTPNITISATVTGVLKGLAQAITTAIANVDYQTPLASYLAPANQFLTSWDDANGFTSTGVNFNQVTGTVSAAQMLALPTNDIYVGNGANQPAATAGNGFVIGQLLTGFVSSTGSVTAADSILSAIEKLFGNAGSAVYSALNSTYIWVGGSNNLATPVTVSGDATLDNTGKLLLVPVLANPGTYTNATVTVSAKGIITGIASGSSGGGGGGSAPESWSGAIADASNGTYYWTQGATGSEADFTCSSANNCDGNFTLYTDPDSVNTAPSISIALNGSSHVLPGITFTPNKTGTFTVCAKFFPENTAVIPAYVALADDQGGNTIPGGTYVSGAGAAIGPITNISGSNTLMTLCDDVYGKNGTAATIRLVEFVTSGSQLLLNAPNITTFTSRGLGRPIIFWTLQYH